MELGAPGPDVGGADAPVAADCAEGAFVAAVAASPSFCLSDDAEGCADVVLVNGAAFLGAPFFCTRDSAIVGQFVPMMLDVLSDCTLGTLAVEAAVPTPESDAALGGGAEPFVVGGPFSPVPAAAESLAAFQDWLPYLQS